MCAMSAPEKIEEGPKSSGVEITTEMIEVAVRAELADYFSDARVTGVGIAQIDDSWIAYRIARRLMGCKKSPQPEV